MGGVSYSRRDADKAQLLAQSADISQNHFIRTSEPAHRFAVQHFWVRRQ